jgi:hypothetical protein
MRGWTSTSPGDVHVMTRSCRRFDRHVVTGVIVAVVFVVSVHSQSSGRPVRPRTIVTTDPELDDSNSLVRFLLYSNEIETEGLIYASDSDNR